MSFELRVLIVRRVPQLCKSTSIDRKKFCRTETKERKSIAPEGLNVSSSG
jgi:hypothetical protein